MSNREMGNCGRCWHSRQRNQLGSDGLYCHESSPQIQLMPGNVAGTVMLYGVWPPVSPEGGCDRFKFDPDKPAEKQAPMSLRRVIT